MPSRPLSALPPALALLLASTAALAVARCWPMAAAPVAILWPPGTTEAEALADLFAADDGWRLLGLRPGAWPGVYAVNDGAPVRPAGALAMFGVAVAVGCAPGG